LAARIEKIIATLLYEAYEHQVDGAMIPSPRGWRDSTGK
jgi:hypothetical protein